MRSIGQGGTQLYSGSIATTTPQAFIVASPPTELDGFGVETLDLTANDLTHCRPAHIRQVGAGLPFEGRTHAGSSRTPLHHTCRTHTIWRS